MAQQMFNPVVFGGFEWTADWYVWNAVSGHLEARRARDDAARRLRRVGHRVRSFRLANQVISPGFPRRENALTIMGWLFQNPWYFRSYRKRVVMSLQELEGGEPRGQPSHYPSRIR